MVITLFIAYSHVAGEPLQQEIEDWYFNVIGKKRCLLIDAWGQTGELPDKSTSYLIRNTCSVKLFTLICSSFSGRVYFFVYVIILCRTCWNGFNALESS